MSFLQTEYPVTKQIKRRKDTDGIEWSLQLNRLIERIDNGDTVLFRLIQGVQQLFILQDISFGIGQFLISDKEKQTVLVLQNTPVYHYKL